MSISKEEYLKRYTQGPSSITSASTTVKKRKKRKVTKNGVTIVDDTVEAEPKYVEKDEDEDEGISTVVVGVLLIEDLPTIVGEVQDRRPKGFSVGEDGSGWTVVEGGNNNNNNNDLSPARKRHDSDDDLSPQRNRTSVDVDLSPPRKRHDSDDDLSPQRSRTSADVDLSPPRKRHDSGGDLSPKRATRSDDLSPKRRTSAKGDDLSPPRQSKPTLSTGGKAGLLTSKEISEEVKARKKKQDARLNADPTKLGKGAETVYRDKRGILVILSWSNPSRKEIID
jgi:pre-mRNA-splicing factor CWC26